MLGGNNNNNNEDERKKWHDKLDEVWDLTDRTFDKFTNKFNDVWSRDWEDTIGNSLPWVSSTFFDSKKENLWAFPVPSARQYDKCKDADGVSAWNKDGIWRCLFNNEHQQDPDNWFTKYGNFLDWRRQMRKNLVAQREKELEQWQSIWKPSSSQKEKYISESEAEKAGKNVTSSSFTSETVTKDDGSLETKRVVKKWYDDGTVSLSESTKNDQNKLHGWFWNNNDNNNGNDKK